MIKKILTLLELNSREWFGKPIRQKDMTFFLTSGNVRKHGTINAFIFEKESAFPFAVAKITRDVIGAISLKAEYINLLNLRSNRLALKGIPQVFCFDDNYDTPFLIESYLEGEPIENHFNNLFISKECKRNTSQMFELLELVFSWITEFHHNSGSEVLASNFINHDELTFRKIDPASIIKLGLIHGDFWAGNILISNSSLNIIDWEYAESDDPLIWDMFYFSIFFTRQLLSIRNSSADEDRAIYILWNDNYWALKMLREFIIKYLAYFNISWPLAEYLLEKLVIKLSQRDYTIFGEKSQGDDYWKRLLIKSIHNCP